MGTALALGLGSTLNGRRHGSSEGRRNWRPLVNAAVPAVAVAAALTVWLGFKIGGDPLTTAVSDIGQAIPALAAAATCGWAARRSNGRLRWAWGMLGASALSWGLGEVVFPRRRTPVFLAQSH